MTSVRIAGTGAALPSRRVSTEELARVLVEAGLGLRRLERVRLELESVFMKLAAGDNASAKSGVQS